MYTAPLLAWLTEKRRQRARLEKAKLANGMADDSLAEGAQKEGELPKSYWDRKKARLDYERTLFRFEVEKKRYVPLDEICGAVGQMLAGFRTAINMLPGSAARWLRVGLILSLNMPSWSRRWRLAASFHRLPRRTTMTP